MAASSASSYEPPQEVVDRQSSEEMEALGLIIKTAEIEDIGEGIRNVVPLLQRGMEMDQVRAVQILRRLAAKNLIIKNPGFECIRLPGTEPETHETDEEEEPIPPTTPSSRSGSEAPRQRSRATVRVRDDAVTLEPASEPASNTREVELLNKVAELNAELSKTWTQIAQLHGELARIANAETDKRDRIAYLPLVARATIVWKRGKNVWLSEEGVHDLFVRLLQNPSHPHANTRQWLRAHADQVPECVTRDEWNDAHSFYAQEDIATLLLGAINRN